MIAAALSVLLCLTLAAPVPSPDSQAAVDGGMDDLLATASAQITALAPIIAQLSFERDQKRSAYENASQRLTYCLRTLFPETVAVAQHQRSPTSAEMDPTPYPFPDHLSILSRLTLAGDLRRHCALKFAEYCVNDRRLERRLCALQDELQERLDLIEMLREVSAARLLAGASDSG